jgi:hypothetical protein
VLPLHPKSRTRTAKRLQTTSRTNKRNAAPTMLSMIGTACQLPGETLGKGEAMRQEFVVNVGLILLNLTIHIYSPKT